jgi:hypothetical protein
VTDTGHGYSNGDEVFLTGFSGMTQISGRSFIVSNASTNDFTLTNTLTGTQIDTTHYQPYVSGGTAARIYTIATPYAASDLPLLKFTQSADTMTLTHPSYPPYDLARITESDWLLTKTMFGSAVAAPPSISIVEVDSGIDTKSFYYQFVATAIDRVTGEESIASPVGTTTSVDIAVEAATITISCGTVSTAGSYNFYSAPVTFMNPPTAGQLFGYIGTAFGPAFTDTNVIPDYAITPPLHKNPFATSSVLSVTMTDVGSGYSATGTTASVVSPIGQNPQLLPIVIGGQVEWIVVQDGGAGMTGGEFVNIIDATGGGSSASATLNIGPSTGTFPSCVAYFQQRRIYANTNNEPDTYFASQPGAFTNMDSSVPVSDSDAIIGSPWSQQVNGIQWMLNMPGGLVIFTGLGAWQLSGAGGGLATSTALTPSNQVANPQAYNGCSPLVPPIAINYDILYVQEKGSIVRDLSYNFFVNIYTGTDMTVLSNHLFDGHTILQWGWAEEPNKLLWLIREDGILLCLTYLKEQDVYAWSRHDTNGLFVSVATVSEPPVNAPYFIVQRLIQNDGIPVWANYLERMDNRQWDDLEQSWCVDAGLSYPQNTPNAILNISSSAGIPTLQQPTLVYGGANYSAATYVRIDDPTGLGAIGTVTIAAGVVTAASVSGNLLDYTDPVFNVIDPSGLGGGAAVNIETVYAATLTASTPVFLNAPGQGEAGDIVRMGDRLIRVTNFVSGTVLTGDVLQQHESTLPDDPLNTPIPAQSGDWTITAPITTVYGLNHLEGMLVSILADGIVQQSQIVVNGTVTLQQPATAIIIGLGFTAQLQTLYLDMPGAVTVQTRRKEFDQVIARIADAGMPFQVGCNQPDQSVSPNMATVPWTNMNNVTGPVEGSRSPIQPYDFSFGDWVAPVSDQLGFSNGQVAIQQTLPLPLTILSLAPYVRIQDDVDA